MRFPLAIAIAATSASGSYAQTSPAKDFALPTPWVAQELPAHEGVHSSAFAEPSGGCYAAHWSIPAGPDVGLSILQNHFASYLSGRGDYQLQDAEKDGSAISQRFQTPSVQGSALLHQSSGSAHLFACYWSERDPTYCRALCDQATLSYKQLAL